MAQLRIPSRFSNRFKLLRNLPDGQANQIIQPVRNIPASTKTGNFRYGHTVVSLEILGSKYPNKLVSKISGTDSVTLADRRFQFPKQLNAVASQVAEAAEILTYKNNWDEEGAEATDEKTFFSAIDFVYSYSTHIFINYGVAVAAPYITIGFDGSVSADWNTPNGGMLIIFKKQTTGWAYYYAKAKSEKITLKGGIKIGEQPEKVLVEWMRKFLV